MTSAEYMMSLLAPTGVYDPEGIYQKSELEAVGNAFDKIRQELETIEREASVTAAEDYGITLWENLFPIIKFGEDTEKRRNALAVLLSFDETWITKDKLTLLLSAVGIKCELTKTDTFTVNCSIETEEESISQAVKDAVRNILPAHLEITYTVASGAD